MNRILFSSRGLERKAPLGFLLVCLFFLLNFQSRAQNKEDFQDYAEMECVEGNCKNGTGTLKVYPKGKDNANNYIEYTGSFVKKKLEGKGTFKGKYWGRTTITGNFKEGRWLLNDTLEIDDGEWKGICVFFKHPNFNSSDDIPLWADLWYYGKAKENRPLRQVGTMKFTATTYGIMAREMEITYANGVRVLGAGFQGVLTLPCGPSGFNDGSSKPVLKDTLPGNVIREGVYRLDRLCIRDGWFVHYMPDGTEYSVRYENDSAVFQYHVSADSIKRRTSRLSKEANQREEQRKLAIWRSSDKYRELMAKYESTTYEAVNAALKKSREEGKKELEKYYGEAASTDPNACGHCKGRGTDARKRCAASGCINGKVKNNAGIKVTILDGGIGRKGVGYTPQYREFECSRCRGEGTWVCYICNGTGKRQP